MMVELSSCSSPSSAWSSSPSSSSNLNLSKKYDVFLNFRGEDTRKHFMGHLKVALYEKRIETFIDDELERGRYISSQLFEAIEDSKRRK
ncbi:TIR domain containing protein [Parasponia andersonii]|uniref:ADP-ribosyl cyclase/cyclic ADP-ribose hydrolase n=1 Tax=Parasponia andersonii TaxID=3476 RepID=A0A2P5AB06_PARAD|nr:TIR domain containing protein [Parasponia andersonii]